MGYQINYQESGNRIFLPDKIRRKPMKYIGITLALGFVIAFLLSPAIKSVLIPGDKAVTTAAFDSFTESIRDGGSIKDAFTVFCKEIIAGAELS